MATISKQLLSGATNNRGILVVATATAGTLIHTTTTTAATLDEIWLWAWNTDTVARVLTLEMGGVTALGDTIEITIDPNTSDPKLVCPGLVLPGLASTGLLVRAFAAATNVITIFGYVNRIT